MGKFPQALAGLNLRGSPGPDDPPEFLGLGKISRGFADGRMLGLHYQWGKSLGNFKEPHPVMWPPHNRIQIGTGFAEHSWWDMLNGKATLQYRGWTNDHWMASFGCGRE